MVSLALLVRSVRIQMLMEKSVIKVGLFFTHGLPKWKVESMPKFQIRRHPISLCNNYEFTLLVCVCVCAQCVTVSMECAIKVQKVMDSVFVSRHTAGSAVTKVRKYQTILLHIVLLCQIK